mmetsp:Transcript_45669/g.97301  ORF Transcript_45669/g.97301 Transcript_45669/m.97301 type:complete len:213 (+) Transcript_45669:577-1215(+)
MVDGPVVGHPLPDVADHVVEAGAVLRLQRVHRSCAGVAVERAVAAWELSLPDVRAVNSIGTESAAPRVLLLCTCSRGELPLRLGRQAATWVGPLAEGHRIGPRDMHHWVVRAAVAKYIRTRPIRMTPGRAINPNPPWCSMHRAARVGIGDRGQLLLEDEGPAEPLRLTDEPRRLGEGGPVRVAHLCLVQPQATDADLPARSLAIDIKGAWRD